MRSLTQNLTLIVVTTAPVPDLQVLGLVDDHGLGGHSGLHFAQLQLLLGPALLHQGLPFVQRHLRGNRRAWDRLHLGRLPLRPVAARQKVALVHRPIKSKPGLDSVPL